MDLAEAEIDRAVELNPGDPEVRAQRGVVYMDQGRLDEAIRELEAVLSLDPIIDPPGQTSARLTTSQVVPRTRWKSWRGTSGGGRTEWWRGPFWRLPTQSSGLNRGRGTLRQGY